MLSATELKANAWRFGFNLVGVSPARPAPHLEAYFRWIEAGLHGEMGYMARADRVARRRDLKVILSEAKSLVIVGLDFHTLRLPDSILNDPARGRIAAYAWGRDYHDVMAPRLEELAASLGGMARVYVDTGALLERDHAQRAGLGFIGKNTMLIHPRRGSDFFLGEILTTGEFDDYDQPARETMCGSCARCLAACPTDAFPQPYILDARRCISYLTIELKGFIPHDLRPRMGNWVFGCDVCQTVCPWNRFAVQTQVTEFFPLSVDRAAPPLSELLALDEHSFADRFGDTPIERIGRERLRRNACIAAGNSRDEALIPPLTLLLREATSPLVRAHAGWALARLGAAAAVRAHLTAEPDAIAREDLILSLIDQT
ncbi:MAG: tRNA epoxyqueuosine(34) reductase QueG [Anaerolineales bacterium]